MQKKSIILGVVFCIFIICSLTYQPIVANESVDTAFDEKDISHNNRFEKININSIIKLLLRSKILGNDCGCDTESKGLWHFPIICFTLYLIALYIVKNGPFGDIGDQMAVEIIEMTAILLGCRWVNPSYGS